MKRGEVSREGGIFSTIVTHHDASKASALPNPFFLPTS